MAARRSPATPVVAALLVVAACSLLVVAEGALTCGVVYKYIAPCLSYASGKGPLPPACCSGVKTLNGLAKTTPDRQAACACLKSAAGSGGLNPTLVKGIPGKCGVSVPYPISSSVDCSKVH